VGRKVKAYEFTINHKLPSYNEYIDACRSHWSRGAKLKKNIEKLIGYEILRARNEKKIAPLSNPCEVYIVWHESTKKRDVDNIQSAQKFILDALQLMKIIPNDSRRYVKQIYHKIVDDQRDFVKVTMVTEGEA
jgi:Holliday junction resolvase RusA-like endonuclease